MIKSLLITGGSGFFGKAFARRALDNGCERVCIYSRSEHIQAQMRADFNNDERLRFFIGDVRDKDRLKRGMQNVEVVIHAAAIKRIEVGEMNPDELVKTNVLGALNVIEAANDAGVSSVVALSTDKAASPANAYGSSKLCAEKLFIAANNISGVFGPTFAACRYGNIFNSSGSVVPTWRARLNEGKTIQVTDASCSRYFMLIEEAVDLVLSAIGLRSLVVPELPSYRLGDLATAIGGEVEVIGMRNGEKRHESMVSEHEMHEFYWTGKYWVKDPAASAVQMSVPLTSDSARRMTVDELREALANV